MNNQPVWDDHPWAGLASLEGEAETDVCVVGLGGSGLNCMIELLKLGRRVIGIDAGRVGGGAAGRNGGFLLAGSAAFYHKAVAGFGHERALRIYRLTMAELEAMASDMPDVVRLVGSLRIAATPEEEEDCLIQLEAMRADGLPVSRYDGPEGRGLLIPTDGVFHPLRRCRLLAERAVEAGAMLFEHSPAISIDAPGAPGRGCEVKTPRAAIKCDRVIVAVDGKLERLLPELAGRVRTVRLQMLATDPAPEVNFPRPVYARWGYEYWQQLPDGRIALGGFRDRGGEGEWTDDDTPTQIIQTAIEDFLRRELMVRAPVTHRWAASVSFTQTGLPIIEEVRPGVWAIGAYNGTGNLIGAIHGRKVANLASGNKQD